MSDRPDRIPVELLGTTSDRAIGERYGVDSRLVCDRRLALGIPACRRWGAAVALDDLVRAALRDGPRRVVEVMALVPGQSYKAIWRALRRVARRNGRVWRLPESSADIEVEILDHLRRAPQIDRQLAGAVRAPLGEVRAVLARVATHSRASGVWRIKPELRAKESE